jgi:hypothetical protein
MSTAAAAAALTRLRDTGFKGAGKRIGDQDLPRIGHGIGCGEDELHAFLDVETRGGGFDDKGRPKALYEPHRAYALSQGAVRAELVKRGLAYPNWRRDYPKDSYPRIVQAMAIDARVALEATSWGIGQVLGSNHDAAGYESAAEMVAACLDDEATQLQQAVNFIKANHLDDELRAHNWAAFARGYNGPSYAANGYHTKLAARYAFWCKIPDTPWSPPAPDVAAVLAEPIANEKRAVAVLTKAPAVKPAAPMAKKAAAKHQTARRAR